MIFFPTDPASVDLLFPVTSSSLGVRVNQRKSTDIYTVSRLMSQSCQHGVEKEKCKGGDDVFDVLLTST